MPNQTCEKLSEVWTRQHLQDVTKGEIAWVLMQEPGFIGFGVVHQDKIFWPPNMQTEQKNWEPDWIRVTDFRLFGEKGEWHVWLDWERKHQCRLLEFDKNDEWHLWLGWKGKNQCYPEKSGEKVNILPEYHYLWGTDVRYEQSNWTKLTEDRGTEIWVPPLKEKRLKTSDLPLSLKIKQVIGYDRKYYLAGIVDAALVGLVRKSGEQLIPDLSLLCSESEISEGTACSLIPESPDTNLDP